MPADRTAVAAAPLADLVTVWQALRGTRARSAKVAALADLLAGIRDDELALAVSFLAGRPRQGRVGVGYAAVHAVTAAPAATASLTLTDVDATLDRLAGTAGPRSQARRAELLAQLFARATAAEQSFLRGLLLQELRQGALESVVADAVARASKATPGAVRRALMLCGDLPAVATAARAGGDAALQAFGLQLFRPLQPMLAQTATSVADALERVSGAGEGGAVVDAKLDGARIQVHRRGADVRVFTRSLRDVTTEVPRVVAAAVALDVDAVVLDGEAIAVAADGRPRPFQDSMAGFAAEEVDAHLVPFFFDCLHLDGSDLIDRPLTERRAALERVVPEHARVTGELVDAADRADSVLADALAAGHEGVVVKAAASTYAAGRRGAAWVKVKPVHTLDLVVLAVEWGSGRRQGWLSNLHLGARGRDGGFVMLGKTFKGLTDRMLAWQTERLLALETGRDGHVVHVRPELVVEVAFDGIQRSSRYPGGVALRFARVKRHRPDKAAAEADTIDTIRDLARSPAGQRPHPDASRPAPRPAATPDDADAATAGG